MLEKFTVSNYKNFKDPITIDFSEVRDYKFNTECVNEDGLITKFIIYGKNASGKSNLGYALFDIVDVLTDNKMPPRKGDLFSRTNLNADNDDNTYSEFSYLFKMGHHQIHYVYSKNLINVLAKESFSLDDNLIFSYDHEKKSFSHKDLISVQAENLNFEYYNQSLSILRYIANNTSQPENSAIRFVMNYVSHMLYFRATQEEQHIGLMSSDINLSSWIVKDGHTQKFQVFLNDIAGLNLNLTHLIEKKVNMLTNEEELSKTTLIENHKHRFLYFDEVASSGTKALEWLYYWSQNFANISLLYFDEFDAYYHFDLARKVVKFICRFPNMQTIFTTHNSYLASNEVMRPDCYLTLENGKLTSFADSTSRELREGHNLEKMLRNGEFND